VTVYHLLTEAEPFSDVDGGAISRWVANTVRGTECVVACPNSDDSWRFPRNQILDLPDWRRFRVYRDALPRGGRFLNYMVEIGVLNPLKVLVKRLSDGDVVWIHNRPWLAVRLSRITRSLGVKIVLHMHNTFPVNLTRREILVLSEIPIVFCSDFLSKQTKDAYPGVLQSTYTLYNGADEQRFYAETKSEAEVPQIVFTGRLVAEKGVHILLAAMRVLSERGVRATCKVFGGATFGSNQMTPYVRLLHKMKPDNTEIAGYVAGEELARLLRQADVFCCPSAWQEPFGMVITEALASGLPVVASRVGGIPEILRYGGGKLVSSNDPEALADALAELVASGAYRERLSKEAQSSFRAHFTWRHIQDRYLQILEEVMA